MQLKKKALHLLVFAVCAALASGCAMQATTGGEDQAAKTGSNQTATSGSSAGSTGSQGGATGGVSGSGFSEQSVVDSGSGTAAGGEVAQLMRVHFDFDRYELTEEARMILAGNASYLKANPTTKIRIEGHCDERGSDEYNLALGERRAMAAKRYLQSLGVDTSRLTIISYGEERPLDKRSNEAAWIKNRRAEFMTR